MRILWTNTNGTLFIVVCLLAALGGCEWGRQNKPEYAVAENFLNFDIPVDEDEAIALLDQYLSDQVKRELVQCEAITYDSEVCRNFARVFKRRLRRALSNEWMRPAGSPIAEMYRLKKITNPELMVDELLNAYVTYLMSK